MKRTKATGKEKCAALDWAATEQGKDYVPCSKNLDTELVELRGHLLKVKVHLCSAHQRYFKVWIERNRYALDRAVSGV